MHKGKLWQLLIAGTIVGVVTTLKIEGTEEGSCKHDDYIPTHKDVNPHWLDLLSFVAGGSKFLLYTRASKHPRFREIREFEFYNNACLYKNASFAQRQGTHYGFGGLHLGEFDIEPAGLTDRRALEDNIPVDLQTGVRQKVFSRLRVTLTDYLTFAVVHTCVMGHAQERRAWEVYSITPELDRLTQKLIEKHVRSLGFHKENIVFLQQGNCHYPPRPVSNRWWPNNFYPQLGWDAKLPTAVEKWQHAWRSTHKSRIPSWGISSLTARPAPPVYHKNIRGPSAFEIHGEIGPILRSVPRGRGWANY